MKDLEKFATAKLSDEGVKIPLIDVEGNPTDHWIKIRGIDSAAFKSGQGEFRKNMLELHELESNNPKKDYSQRKDKEMVKLISSLVVSWSFKNDDGTPYECNQANKIDVLNQAPVLVEEIDKASARRKNFIKRSLSKSANTQSKNSSSKKDQQKVKSVS